MGEEVINANCLYKVAEGRSFPFAFPNPSEPIPGLWLWIPDRYVPIKLCSPAFNTVETTSTLKHLVTTSNHFLLV